MEDQTYFEVKIDASSIKFFSAALHLAQKVGKDLILGALHRKSISLT
jgi:hypothetical protein